MEHVYSTFSNVASPTKYKPECTILNELLNSKYVSSYNMNRIRLYSEARD